MKPLILCLLFFIGNASLIPKEFLPKRRDCTLASVYEPSCYCLYPEWLKVPWNIDFMMSFVNYNKFVAPISFESFVHRMVFRPFSHFHQKNFEWLVVSREPRKEEPPLIPLKQHRIWISKGNGILDRSLFRPDYFANIKNDFQFLGPSWEYIFWFYKEPFDPFIQKQISAIFSGAQVSFRDARSLELGGPYREELELQFQKKFFNCMADSLRLQILAQEGGLYVDTDIKLNYNVTKFAFRTRLLMLSQPLFLFHHFMMVAPHFHSELLLNVTYAHRNNFNGFMELYNRVALDPEPSVVILVRHHLGDFLYSHKSEKRYASGSEPSNLRVHSHDVNMMVRKALLPYFGQSYQVFPDVLRFLKEPVVVYRKEMEETAPWFDLGGVIRNY
jgi:Glycosyltransferase sugar-binding region containing DXD motif